MPLEGQPVSVTWVDRVEDIPASAWAECFRAPLEGHFWYQTMDTCGLEDQFTFRYARMTAGGRTVGIAPCFLFDVPITLVAPPAVAWVLTRLAKLYRRFGYQRTLFVGSPCSDEGTVGLVPGVALRDVLDELRAAVEAQARAWKAPMVVFKDFPETDLAAFAASDPKGVFCPTVSYPGTVVPLPGPDKEAYHRSLAHTQRHNLLKKLRRSREILPLDTSVVARPSDVELTEIFALFMQTYEKGKTKFERLDRRFFERIRECPEARFILQRDPATGELLTFMLVFCLGDRVINKFIGIDYRRSGKTYLYFRLFDAAVDLAYAQGAREIQSGQTGYRAKFDLGHRLVPLFNLFRHENPLVNVAFRAVGRRVTWQSLDEDLATYLRAHPGHKEKG